MPARSVFLLLPIFIVGQAKLAEAQESPHDDAAPRAARIEATTNAGAPKDASNACDLAAASPYDKQRPADVPGVAVDALHPDIAVPACEAAVRAAPQDPRMSYQLARAYRNVRKYAEALPLLQNAAQSGNALAANDLAVMYAKGQGVAVDLKAQLYYLDQAARAGLSVAEFNYGNLYKNGNAVLPKNEDLARKLVTLAAKDNYPPAMASLGHMLSHGIGGTKDDVEARYWYEQAAKAGNYSGMAGLGFCLQTGKGGKKDLNEARQWFEKSASGNDPVGTNDLGWAFESGMAGPQDLKEARRLYEKAIALGEKQFAARNLERVDRVEAARAKETEASEAAINHVTPGEAVKACDLAAAGPYDKQRPIDIPAVTSNTFNASAAISACQSAVHAAPQDPRMLYQLALGYRSAKRFSEALPLFQQAAQMGNGLAANDLAGMYAKGEGVGVDLKAQLYYLDQAARAGFAVAEYNYGNLYLKGNAFLPKDEGLARQLMLLSAKEDYPPAMYLIGKMFMFGIGGKKDDFEARYWYKKAALAGNYGAMNNFGYFLQEGKGGEKNLVEARKWFEKSANGNDPIGRNCFGYVLMNGLGGPKDFTEARRQFEKAIASGEKEHAADNLALLEAAEKR